MMPVLGTCSAATARTWGSCSRACGGGEPGDRQAVRQAALVQAAQIPAAGSHWWPRRAFRRSRGPRPRPRRSAPWTWRRPGTGWPSAIPVRSTGRRARRRCCARSGGRRTRSSFSSTVTSDPGRAEVSRSATSQAHDPAADHDVAGGRGHPPIVVSGCQWPAVGWPPARFPQRRTRELCTACRASRDVNRGTSDGDRARHSRARGAAAQRRTTRTPGSWPRRRWVRAPGSGPSPSSTARGELSIGRGCDISSGVHIYTHSSTRRCVSAGLIPW